MSELSGIFKLIEEHTFTTDKCFLCGCTLDADNKTEEHVIPKWIQREFNLWDQKLGILNGTLIPYRLLTIPCCFECNNIYLSPFEETIKTAYQKGFEEFCKLDRETIFLWVGKIYFGLMYRQLFLKADITDASKGTITSPEYLRSFYSHFLFLQGIRRNHSFKDFFPASIYCFHTQKPNDIKDQWDLMDSHAKMFIAIRMGEIGLIVVLQDCEATFQLNEILDQHRDIILHPLQFKELSAKIFYKALLMNRVPKFLNVETNGHTQTVMMSLQGLSDIPIFDDWDNDLYSIILSQMTGVPLEICQPEKGKVWTWLWDSEGKSIFIDVNKS
jgi:hypothetical protein